MTALLAPLAPYITPTWTAAALIALCRLARAWARAASRANRL